MVSNPLTAEHSPSAGPAEQHEVKPEGLLVSAKC